MIRIKRESGFKDSLRAYKIVMDGEIIGGIENGQVVDLNVPPGKHQLFLKIDWCRSNSIDFVCGQNIVEFECGNNIRGWRILFGIIYATFLRNKYLWLTKIG